MVHENSTGSYLGLLDSIVAKALTVGFQWPKECVAYLVEETRNPGEYTNTRSMDIVLSSQESFADLIGDFLSTHEIFLQHPHREDIVWLYRNPQYFLSPGETYTTLPAEDENENKNATIDGFDLSVDSDADLIKDVFTSAQGPNRYTSVGPSARLRTPLKMYPSKNSM
jgi:hypothetical protein